MYIKGIFKREYSELFDNDKPMPIVFIVEDITKEDLLAVNRDDNYQIIDIETGKYYDPKSNKWIKLNRSI